MNDFLPFFEQMPTWQRLGWVLICLAASWVLESGFPLVRMSYRKWRHAGVNTVFLVTSIAINVGFGIATLAVVELTSAHRFGLLYLLDFPIWIELLLAVALLDFVAQYAAHFLLHKVGWMWRVHVVHHTDTKVDATTGFRLHPGDYSVRETFALMAMAITGAPLAFYMVYRIATILFTFVAHANVASPRWLDGPMSLVLVTPNMHKFHHHCRQPWTDRNYGGILSVWDRLFGTFVYGDPREVRYGLDAAAPGRDSDVLYQLALPFRHAVGPSASETRRGPAERSP